MVESNDWQAQDGWVGHLAQQVGAALTSIDAHVMDTQLDELEDILASGNDDVARLLAQAALYRAVKGPVTKDSFNQQHVTDPSHLQSLILEATSVSDRSPHLARAVEAVARVSVEQRAYGRARELFLFAASIRSDSGDEAKQAVDWLRAGACAFELDNNEEALETTRRARDAYLRLGDPEGATLALLNMMQIANAQEDIEAAADLLQQARSLSDGRRDGQLAASLRLEEASLSIQQGEVSEARKILRSVYKSARRRGDLQQALVATKNLAIAADHAADPGREIHWWRAAADLADELRDWRDSQDIQRTLGIALTRSRKYMEAESAFDRAIALNEAHENRLGAAQSKADKGAALLEHATAEGLDDDEFDALTTRALNILSNAREELEALTDFRWAAITVRNLRTAWILRSTEADGAKVLIETAEKPGLDPDYKLELRRNAAWLLLSAGSKLADDGRATQWLIDAASDGTDDGLETAWSLAKQAATLAHRGFNEAALRLYDVALEKISPDNDGSAFGNILNDSVVVMADDAAPNDIRERLLRVEHIARSTSDRVLLSLALSNLGETAVRADDLLVARRYFTATAELALEIGDEARAAIALASLSNTYVGEGKVHEATQTSEEALGVAARSGSDEAWVRATSAAASAAYLRGDYETAYRDWLSCSDREDPVDRGEHQAYALDSLAKLGNWPRFRRELERFAKQSQRANTQFGFVSKLYMPALTWLHSNRPAAAGHVIAVGILLAFEAASLAYGARGRILSTADRERTLTQVGSAMGPVRAVFELLELPDDKVRAVRASYERTVRSAVGEDADDLLRIVDENISDAASETLSGSGLLPLDK